LAVLQLLENGFLEELKKKWWIDGSECGAQAKVILDFILISNLHLALKVFSTNQFYRIHQDKIL
jgi:hypothetical protein